MDLGSESNRIIRQSAKYLENDLARLEDSLSEILKTRIRELENHSAVREIATQCKTIYKQYCETNFKLVQYKTTVSALSEADELRNDRQEFKREVRELINIINSVLGDDEKSISFNTSSLSLSVDDTENSLQNTVSGNNLFNMNTLSRTLTSQSAGALPVISESHPQQTVNFDFGNSNYNKPPDIYGNHLTTADPRFFSSSPLPVTTISNVNSFRPIPSVSSQFTPFKNNHTVTSLGSRLEYIHLGARPKAQFKHVAPPITSTVGSHPTSFSGNSNPPLSHFSQYQPNNSVPFHTNAPPLMRNSNHMTDALTNHILKNQLFQKVGEPFNGDAHKYHAWVNVMQRKMSGLSLDPWDTLTILHENTLGKPKKVIEDFMNIGAANPELTLTNVWNALYDQFGTGSRIASAIINKLDSFPNIKSIHDSEKLGDLINICHIIVANIAVAEELQIFNLSLGLRRIWIKLPEALQNGWRTSSAEFKHSHTGSNPSLQYFIAYLERKHREYSDPCYDRPSSSQEYHKAVKRTTLKTSTDVEPQISTPKGSTICLLHPLGKHQLGECNSFRKKPFSEKKSFIVENKRCFTCLGPHFKQSCTEKVSCSICKGKHTTAMHRDVPFKTDFSRDSVSLNPDNSKPQPNVTSSSLCTKVCGGDTSKSCSKVLLVDLSLPSGSSKTLRCYVILDEQSSASFVDPKVVRHFNLDLPRREYKIRTLTGLETTVSGMIVNGLKVKGVYQKKLIHLPPVMTNDFIPNCKNEIATLEIVSQHSHIAHDAKHFPPIDGHAEVLMLLGRDSGTAMFTQCFGYKAPYAHRTPIGWALVGNVCASQNKLSSLKTVLKVQVDSGTFEHVRADEVFPKKEMLQRILEDPFAESPDDEMPGPSKNDAEFMHRVVSSTRINAEGNITMPLPFRREHVTFPDNKAPVYHRMVNTLSKMKTDPDKLSQCLESMQKNISSGHVEQVPPEEITPNTLGHHWYIPVFAVTHPKKKKIRLVFDSAASYYGTSLNNELLQGPDINTQLATVLSRFRKKKVAFTADIESMFYAFHLEPTDRNYTRFFWWENNDPSNRIIEYRATRHIFGNRSSPSLANIGIRYAVTNSEHSTDRSRDFVYNNFYVDDGCGSADSEGEAIGILKETRAALSSYNIHLHKIASSSMEVLKAFPNSELSGDQKKDFNHLESQRTLGVEWNPSSDSFVIRTNVPDKPFTKRGTLATTNSLFDPLGFASPIVLTGRLLQRFFIPPKDGNPNIVKLNWDDPLPEEHRPLWNDWITSLRSFDSQLHIPRSFCPPTFGLAIEQTLHVFCDASEEGIGCVMYLRSLNANNQVHVSFVTGNSRVAPRGTSSIPRLELCAALEASTLAYKISQDLDLDSESIHFYSDSQVVLGYLFNTCKRFSRYVTRRVTIILKTTSIDRWHYIPTDENPGDVASRPQSFQSLTESCWFRGPSLLWKETLPTYEQPTLNTVLPESIEEISTFRTSLKSADSPALSSSFTRVNTWSKLINVTKLVLDFIIKTSEKAALRKGKCVVSRSKTSNETATYFIIRAIQMETYPRCSLSSVPEDISKLSPFFDNSIIKVGGRLKHSEIPSAIKFPILVPASNPASTLLIQHFHKKVKHQGRIITTAAIREAGYYIHHGTSTVKKIIHSCITCRKLRERCLDQKMSDLPYDRLEESPPFTYCGMDVFGHFNVSEGITTRRNASIKKTWAIVFICLVTKAVHIEPLPYMDTSTFKLALQRFFSIRGVCRKLRSDCGTNFIGARNQDLNIRAVQEEIGRNDCEWEFNPPHSSHFGGLWERSIRSIRKILDASLLTLGSRHPSRDELHTFLLEAAAIINNTPMYEISNDPNDQFPLTPANLLTLKDSPNPPPLETFSDHDLLSYGSRRWRRVQALSENFWLRWRKEYVQQLQNRQKWLKQKPNLQQGDIVLMKIKNSKRNVWPMARVDDVKLSEDGLVRSATLLVPSADGSNFKFLNRPVTEIVPILRKCEASAFE